MSAFWAAARPGLVALICKLSGLNTQWQDAAQHYHGPSRVLLKVRSTQSVGIDEARFTATDEPAPALNGFYTVTGLRRINLDIRVESYQHDAECFAFNAIEDIRDKIFLPSGRAALRELDMSLIRVNSAVDIPNIVNDQRITSVAVLDLELLASICVADKENRVATIEKVCNPPEFKPSEPC